MNIKTVLLLLFSYHWMKGLGGPASITHVTCRANTIVPASVTCNFNKNMKDDRRPINVVRYTEGKTTDKIDVLVCAWEKQNYECRLEDGFSVGGNITDKLTLKLPPNVTNFTGLYSCFVVEAKDTQSHGCRVTVKARYESEETTKEPPNAENTQLLWLISLVFVIAAGVVIAVVLWRRKRKARNRRPKQANGNMSSPDAQPLISREMEAPNCNMKQEMEKYSLSGKELRSAMKAFSDDISASLRGDTATRSVTCGVTLTNLPTNEDKGAFLVVNLSSTTLSIRTVRLEDHPKPSQARNYQASQDDIRETGKKLFDFVAGSVSIFLKENKMSRKKFRLVFIFSFTSEFDTNFIDAKLKTWSREFRCEGVEGRPIKELLEEAMKRKKVPETVKVVTVINDAVATLMSVSWKDPNCTIGFSIMNGFRACYLQGKELTVADLGNLGENGCLEHIRSESDKCLDENGIHVGKQTLEKMASLKYIGETIRLELVRLKTKGLLFKNASPDLPKLFTTNSIKKESVTRVESDTDNNLQTKVLLEELGISDCTPEDYSAVRYVYRVVLERAADLTAAGLASIINRMNQSEITIAAEKTLDLFHPRFLQRVENRTRELVQPHLKIKFQLAVENCSTGAARLSAAVLPKYPRYKPPSVI